MAQIINPSDEAWSVLLDDDTLNKRRDEAEYKYRDLSGSQIKDLRKLAKTDLFFLANAVLGYELLSEDFHGHYTQWLAKVKGERYRMTLFARDHYKTTINTISDSIQMALPNDAGVTDWPYCLGPDVKILLSHENRESASRFLYEITQAFRAKPFMLALFPELIPSPRIQRMNKWELELPRNAHDKEPTFDTIGAGGAAQGRHYNWLKNDDLFGENARDSITVMKTLLLWFDNINSLLTRLKIDGWDLTGTRWAATDVYSHAVKQYGVNKSKSVLNAYDPRDIERMEEGQLVVYARGAIEDGLPVFPEEFSLEDLNRIRRNARVWGAQYANNPRESNLTKFQPGWLKTYNVGRGDGCYVFGGENNPSWSVRTSELDRVILCDPTVGETDRADEAGIIVTGTDSKLNVFILETVKEIMTPPEFIDRLLKLYMKWNPRVVSIESVVFSAVFKYWFEDKCKELGVYPSIYDYKPGQKQKDIRIQGLANYGAAGQLYVLEGMHQLKDEWEWFPLGDSKHLLDALAQGPEVWAPSLAEHARDIEEAIQLVEEERDIMTGYSSI